jgi:DNA polymerase III epsilon subunit-like protein
MQTREKTLYKLRKENPRFVLLFDTETTGLIPNNLPQLGQMTDELLKTYPYITQLSVIVYDLYEKMIVSYYNTYINIPQDVEISQEITQLTGVTREKCNAGVNIIKALNMFYDIYKKCDILVAHNMMFDSQMIRIECRRHYTKIPYIKMTKMFYNAEMNNVHVYCTMLEGKKYCSLNKRPRLQELYELLFEEDFETYEVPLHNSLVDTLVCLRCYLKIGHDIDISHEEFGEYMNQLQL